jgi:cell division protein FtsB
LILPVVVGRPAVRLFTAVLIALLAFVSYELWFGRGGVPRVRELQARLTQQNADNAAAEARNERLAAEVRDLKEGLEMVEERARFELGMVKPDEILVQVTSDR